MNDPEPFLPYKDGPMEERESYPRGFQIAVGLTAVYLLYRLGQGVIWLVSKVFN